MPSDDHAINQTLPVLDLAYTLVRCLLAAVFIYAGTGKLLDPEGFAILIEAYGLLPDALLRPAAILLPALEVLAGIGLLFDLKGSLAVITALLLLFIFILGYGIQMGLDVDCGCFGPEDPEADAFHGLRSALYRDLAMLGGAALIYAWRRCRAIRPVSWMPILHRNRKERRLENAVG